jgi:hypothetical protein
LLNARALNPKIFMIVRQELHVHKPLFSVAGARLIMRPYLSSAGRILFELIAGLPKFIFERARTMPRHFTVHIDKHPPPAALRII